MRYFCEISSNGKEFYFISDVEPNDAKIKTYAIKDDDLRVMDLEKNISILNASSHHKSAHNLIFIYQILSEICVDESSRSHFNNKASKLAINQISIFENCNNLDFIQG